MGIKAAAADVTFMNELFTTAEAEAHRLGDEMPGGEHLLLAALAIQDASGREALHSAGSDADAFRAAVAEQHAQALRAVGVHAQDAAAIDGITPGPFRSSAAAQQVFQRAVALSKTRRPRRLRTADVVRAVAERDGGTAARALAALGIDRTALIAAADTAAST